MAYGNLRYYPLVACSLRIYPVLLEFIEKKKWKIEVKIGYGKSVG